MEHWEAWCNLGGSLLGALGGLYLTYDILGGKDGPLAGVTRVVTYTAIFGVAYSIGMGLRFGLIASLGMGVNLGYDFYMEARRMRAKGKRRHWVMEILLGSSRALALTIGLSAITNPRIAVFFFPIYAFFNCSIYLLGFSPVDNLEVCRHLVISARNIGQALLRTVGAGLSFWAAGYLAWATASQPFSLIPPWQFGLTIGGASFIVAYITPWVEWKVDRLSRRSLAVVGVTFAIVGFLIQAVPNWIVLLQ